MYDNESVSIFEDRQPYKKDDQVEGTVYEISEKFGIFVAVDNCYQALIPKREPASGIKVGDHIKAPCRRSARRWKAEFKSSGKSIYSDGQRCGQNNGNAETRRGQTFL